MTQLSIENLCKRFDDIEALRDIAFSLDEGEFFCVVGPTNAGKSTLLKTIAGLHRPDRGTIRIKGRDVTHLQPRDRNVSLLFQNIALFPTLSAYDNIAFPLRAVRMSAAEIKKRVTEIAELLRVSHLLDRLPRTYSGGEQQRVAIGRALVRPGDLLMLDEPLTNLDARIRIALRIEFKKIHRELGQSLIYVTHDQVEAMSLSDNIAVMHEGRFQQIGSPEDIYHRPANDFVARFIGQPPMNILDIDTLSEGDTTYLVVDGMRLPLPPQIRVGDLPRHVAMGVRPESVRVSKTESPATPTSGRVEWVERLGHKSHVDIRIGGTFIRATVPANRRIGADENIWIGFDVQPQLLLDSKSGEFLR
jgi:multiple sugar transport system ATP-binding protein